MKLLHKIAITQAELIGAIIVKEGALSYVVEAISSLLQCNKTMKASPLNSLLLLAIWPTTVVVQAFASSSSSHKAALLSPPKSFLQKHHQNNHLHKSTRTTTTHLNLFGSTHAAAAAAATTTKSVATAVTNLIPRGGGAVAERVSSWASTPNGSFNLALGVLAASTAILKVYNRVDSDKDEGAVVVRYYNI